MRAVNALQVGFEVLRLGDNHFLATLFKKLQRAFDFRPHAARCKMPCSKVLATLFDGHAVNFNLVFMAEIECDLVDVRRDDEVRCPQFAREQAGCGVLVDHRRARPQFTVGLVNNRDAATTRCDNQHTAIEQCLDCAQLNDLQRPG